MNKILTGNIIRKLSLFMLIGIVLFSYVSANNYPASFVSGSLSSGVSSVSTSGNNVLLDLENIEYIKPECGGCKNDEKCYNIGTRLTLKEKYNQSYSKYITENFGFFSWLNNNESYCGIEKTFLEQKEEGQSCVNDFECQSNQCLNNLCSSRSDIKKHEIFRNQTFLVESIVFESDTKFSISGLKNNYLIGFGKRKEGYSFFINNNLSSYENKTLFLSNYSRIDLNGILFEDGKKPRANITLIESSISNANFDELLKQLGCNGLWANESCKSEGEHVEINGVDYIVENKSLKEIIKKETPVSITGATIGAKNDNNLLQKIAGFLKSLFGFS